MTFQPGANLYTQGFGSRPENVEVPVVSLVAPSITQVNYPIGKRWIDTTSNTEYVLTSNPMVGNVITAAWTLLGTNTGALNTLSDTIGTTVTPSAGNIQIAGTASEITSTAGSGLITLSLPAAIVAPGSLTTTTTLTVGTNATIDGNLTVNGTISFTDGLVVAGGLTVDTITESGNQTIGGTLGVTGLTTLAALTQVGVANINATGTAATNIGGSTGKVTITTGTGNFALVGGGNTVGLANDAAANVVTVGSLTGAASLALQAGTGNITIGGVAATTVTIGAAAQTGTMIFGNSSAANITSLGIGNGANTTNISTGTGGNAINIGTGAGANTTILGTTNTTSTTTIRAGSGGIVMTGAIANSSTITSAGNVLINGAGTYLGVHHGAVTDFAGACTLASGTVTVANTNIAAGDIILPTRVSVNGSTTLGVLTYTISAATSFTITSVILGTPASTQTADTSILNYVIVRPI